MVSDTIFFVVRHGETEWNAEARIQGQRDSRLTPQGERQADAIARRLAGETFDALVSSDLGRAVATAERIAARCGMAPALDTRLRERHFGTCEGMTYADAGRAYPNAFPGAADAIDADFAIPGGESRREFHERIVAAFDDLAREHAGRRVVVVTHGGVLAAMYRHANAIPVAGPHKVPITNACFNRLSCRARSWSVDAWADAAHLEEAEPFEEA